jgi:regulator of telomere elongation helicase 1
VKLKELIDTMSIPNDGVTYKGDYIYDLFRRVNVTSDTKAVVLQLIETAADLLSNDSSLVRSFRSVSYLSNLSEALRKLFMDDMGSVQSIAEHYKVHIQDDKRSNSGPGQYFQAKATVRRLSFWCFNAGIIMQDLAKSGVRNFILTSGTLSPLDSFAYELSLDFPVESRLENPHVIDTRQIWVGTASKAPSGERLLGTFSARTDNYLVRNAI